MCIDRHRPPLDIPRWDFMALLCQKSPRSSFTVFNLTKACLPALTSAQWWSERASSSACFGRPPRFWEPDVVWLFTRDLYFLFWSAPSWSGLVLPIAMSTFLMVSSGERWKWSVSPCSLALPSDVMCMTELPVQASILDWPSTPLSHGSSTCRRWHRPRTRQQHQSLTGHPTSLCSRSIQSRCYPALVSIFCAR